ncbi:hypothetical protein DH2020_028427 [Rehmannia glutinosa]|uniref:DEK-C domain-containing protein n=1 Tax=Rehmannia glutinosa TaxID=99300 RepID=A0ABR0VUZ2_REHGL
MAEEEGEELGIEQQLERAVCARLQHFKDQADSLTLESVRRLLEKDLGLEKFALDAHKRFIRQYLEKKPCLISNTRGKPCLINDILFDFLVGTQGSSLSESSIKKAIWERADHFQANSENITLAGVRRLLEEDLGLEKNTLDPFKKFISQQIDQVLNPPKGAKSVNDVKKKASENLKTKKSKKKNIKKVEQPKKRKISRVSDQDISGKKQNKLAKRQKEEETNNDEDGSLSEDGQSQSSAEKPAQQRKEKLAPGYGKQVENLKSIIKACGMSVAPSIYKKAKQVPEEKREAFIVKELEGILSREGLSKNPSEKVIESLWMDDIVNFMLSEIKDCRRRKETARELEGIDMSNIISSSRRRSTFSFVAPVTPGIRAKKDTMITKKVIKFCIPGLKMTVTIL